MSQNLQSGKTYVLINVKADTIAMDLSGQDHRTCIGFPIHRGENQQWKFEQHSDGWTIQNRYNGHYLDTNLPGVVNDSVGIVASNIQQKKWAVEYDSELGGYRILSPGSNYNVDLSDHGNPAPGTPIVLWSRWKGKNQVWKLSEV